MFSAVIVVCFGAALNTCVLAEDTRGPYITQAQCKVRLKEMEEDTLSLLRQRYLDVTGISLAGDCKVVNGKGPVRTI